MEDFMGMDCIFRNPSFKENELLAPILIANLASDCLSTEHNMGHNSLEWPLAAEAIFCAEMSLLLLNTPQGIKKLPMVCFVDIWKRAWPWIHLTSTFHKLVGYLDMEDLFSSHITVISVDVIKFCHEIVHHEN
jgi:hypothetical protein